MANGQIMLGSFRNGVRVTRGLLGLVVAGVLLVTVITPPAGASGIGPILQVAPAAGLLRLAGASPAPGPHEIATPQATSLVTQPRGFLPGKCVPMNVAVGNCASGETDRSSPSAASYEGWGNFTPYLAQSPSPRWGAAMAYDANALDRYVVLFGGEGPNGPLGDTWIFQGGEWTNATPSTPNATNTPTPRYGAAMTYDSSDGYVLLFGGASGPIAGASDPFLNDTWEFVHGAWARLCALCSPGVTEPGPRFEASISDDPADQGVLLFGGLTAGGAGDAPLNDTWIFSAGSWSLRELATSPPARYEAEASLVPPSGPVLLVNGCSGTTTETPPTCAGFLSDEWTYAAGAWTQTMPTPAGPGARAAFGFAASSTEGSVLAFGGLSAAGLLNQTWSLDEGTWNDITNSLLSSPPARDGVSLAFDLASGTDYFIAFGGWNGTCLNETWLYPSPFSPLRVSAPFPSLPVTDAGHPIWLNVTVAGGSGPYNRTWFGLPSGCGTANTSSLVCHPASPPESESAFYGVSVRVRDSRGSIVWSSSTEVEVNARPLASVAPLTTNVGTVPLNVTMKAIVVGGTPPFTFSWDWADGSNNSTGSPASHEYTTVGNFTVRVLATDSLGESWLSGGLKVVAAPPLGAQLTVNPTSVSLGSPVAFQTVSGGGFPPYAYSWSGLPSSCPVLNASTITCSPSAYGTYNVSVHVTDLLGDKVTASATLVVRSQFPFLLIGIGVAVASAIALIAAVWALRRSHLRKAAPAREVDPGPSESPSH